MTSLPAIPGALSHTVQIARQRGGLNASKTKNMLRTVDMSVGVQLEPVTSDDTERHSIALEILVSGYVDAYIEFFSLTEHNPSWHNDVDILRLLQLNLARAEEARRKGDALLTCNSYNQLAAYFESKGDRDTAFHFYNMCIEALNSAPGNIGKKAETYGQIGLLAEMRGACVITVLVLLSNDVLFQGIFCRLYMHLKPCTRSRKQTSSWGLTDRPLHAATWSASTHSLPTRYAPSRGRMGQQDIDTWGFNMI